MTIEDVYPLAPVQQGMLFHVLQAPSGAGIYWAQGLYEFTGPLDVDALRGAWQSVLDRHTALRTGFVWDGVPEPLQVVHAGLTVPFETLDWSALGEDEQHKHLQEFLEADQVAPFDLGDPPLMRLHLIGRDGHRHWLVWTFHHICLDGWSLPIVLDEVQAGYDRLTRGDTSVPAPPPARPYRDFITWLTRQDAGRATRFWQDRMAGFDAPTPLPVDRTTTDHWQQDRVRVELPEDTTRRLSELARRARVTTSTVVQAGWALVLGRHSGQRDVTFGLTVSGRPADLPGMESMVGMFINTLPLRTDIRPDEPFTDWLRRLQDTQLGMRRFDHTPLTDIARAAPVGPGTSLFDSVLVVGNYPQEQRPEPSATDGNGEMHGVELLEQSNYPLMLVVDLETRLRLQIEFSTAAFDTATAERLLDRLGHALTAVAADPDLVVGDVPLHDDREQRRLEARSSGAPAAGSTPPLPVTDLIRRWARRTPDTVAVACGAERTTFAELDRRAGYLAGVLAGHGAGAETGIGVLLPRSTELAVAFVAALRSGGTYVPLPLGHPAERLRFMAADAGVRVLLTTGSHDTSWFTGTVLDAGRLPPPGDAPEDDPCAVDRDQLAYVAYTSGSTGTPKGVGVSHRALAAYAAGWETRLSDLDGDPGGPVLAMSGTGFDVSVGDLTRGLCLGRGVVLLPDDDGISVERLHETIREHRVGIAEIVPGVLLRELAAYSRGAGRLDSLRVLVSGTDTWRQDALVETVGAVAPAAVPGNVYGVTEAAIDSLFMPLTGTDSRGDAMAPVGTPLPGVRALVLDEHLRMVPVGVPGELFLGGDGVARGYLNRPDLTAERFLPDPTHPGQRLYRTGDRARWNTDHHIEFLGRIDDQIKLRGYRIEPGEIQAVLTQHPTIRDAIVTIRDDGPGGRRLVAYLVPDTTTPPDTTAIRDFAATRLPGYMIPATFVVLDDGLPLTPNGKVDHRALPAPDPAATGAGEYVAPRTDAERTLVEVWRHVLGLERLGVEENFFELGGDSILSLQIVTRARAAGLRVAIADVLARQTVSALALAATPVDPVSSTADQGTVSGPVPLTPIEHWFLAQDIADRDHWNWSGMVELAPGTDHGRLARAFDLLVDHHDALRLRLVHEDGRWDQQNAATAPGPVLTVEDVTGLPGSALDEHVTRHMTGVQRSLGLADGPLLRAVLFDRGDEPARLGIVAHHLVVDGVSWTILLDDLGTAYETGGLGAKTTSFRTWANRLSAHADTPATWSELGYWHTQLERRTALPVDHDGPDTEESTRVVRAELDPDTTAALQTRVHRAYRTRINDLLLAALLPTIGRWAGTTTVGVDFESHGREPLDDYVDVSRTVGWFTSVYPVTLGDPDLDDSALDDPAELITSVKEHLRAVPRRGIGYGLVRYLTAEPGRAEDRDRLRALRNLPGSQILVNYMGGMETAAGRDDGSGLITGPLPDDLTGPDTGPETGRRRSHGFQIEVSLADDGRLLVEWFYSANRHDADTVRRLAERHVATLRELVAHCLTPDAGRHTPSDFPLARVDRASLARVAATAPGVVDLYPLAPVQQGMLFHVLQAPAGNGVYWAQGLYEFTGHLDVDAMRRAWQVVLDRHTALRTGFVWEEVAEPHQFVIGAATVPFEALDWSGAGEDEQRRRLDELLAADRTRGFDLTDPPLTRIHLIDRGDRWWMVWGLFQGLCDGWSLPVVLDELHDVYRHHLRGERPELPAVRPYRDFIAWLGEQDDERAGQFWRAHLAGFEAPTPLPVDRVAVDHWQQHRIRAELSPDTTRGLVELARRARVTLSTAVQAGWALLLSRLSGRDDVLFGLTVSGRPAELPGMESMVGLFINTLPLRTTVRPDEPFLDWLQRLQDTQVDMQRFDHTPLTDIHRASEVAPGTPLFDSILVVGNYPREQRPEPAGDAGTLDGLDSIEQGNSPLMLVADLTENLSLELEFSTAAFDTSTAERLLAQMGVLLAAAAADPATPVGRIALNEEPERRRLLAVGDAGRSRGPEPLPAAERVRRWAARRPDATAVVCGAEHLTFAELEHRADRLARVLAEHGTGSESGVGVLLPRSADLATTFLAVLTAGGVYVPLPLGHPPERLRFMAADAGVETLVTTGGHDLSWFTGTVLRLDDLAEPDAAHAPRRERPDPEQLAYVAYTSGSTGTPKGVGVTHRALAGYADGWDTTLSGLAPAADGDGHGPVLSMAGTGFDVSVGDLTRGLCLGGGLVLLPETGAGISVERLHETIRDHRVTVAEIVPGVLLRELAAWSREAGRLDSLRVLISGTDTWRRGALTGTVAEIAPDAVPGNVYGVTEAAIDSLFMPLCSGDGGHADNVVPVGRPLPGVHALVLDDLLVPTAVGVPGELFIGGHGVARGYLNRPDLTAERFLPDPTHPGQRLYRTGDRARWNTDHHIEFLGRIDDQIKLRGYRIEPGEIQAVLTQHPTIRDTIVTTRDDGPGGRRLVGYLVPEDADGPDVAAIREFAATRLPGYMIPAAFVVLHDGLPLTPNGKVDHRALPAPDPVGGAAGAYVAPRTDAEQALVDVWRQTLGLERVGVEDNFFELGGDSILSLQIVSRARAAGLRIDVADVFTRQTVAALAAVAVRADPAAGTADQGTVSGPVPLTPIEHWFLAQDIADRDHWNWSGVVELTGAPRADALARAFDLLVDHHDALRLRLTRDGGNWHQHNAGTEPHPVLSVVDATGLDGRALDDHVTEHMTRAQTALDLAEGPLLRAVLFDRGDRPARLGITAHHLVMDGVSWTVLLDDLATAHDTGTLGAKTTSFRSWARHLHSHADTPATWKELAYWRDQLDRMPALPTDRDGRNTEDSTEVVRAALDAGTTATLRTRAHRAYRTQTNDIVLAALLRALGRWAGTTTVGVDFESHGRAPLDDGIDVSRTVGWFTSIHPLALTCTDPDDPAQLITSVKEHLHNVPRGGIGYGLLRHLTTVPENSADRDRLHGLRALPEPQVLFNNMGTMETGIGGGSGPKDAELIAGPLPDHLAGPVTGPETGRLRSHLLQVEASQTEDGLLLFEWHYSAAVHHESTVRDIAERHLAALRDLIDHCLSPGSGQVTPSDFPLSTVDGNSLSAIIARMGGG